MVDLQGILGPWRCLLMEFNSFCDESFIEPIVFQASCEISRNFPLQKSDNPSTSESLRLNKAHQSLKDWLCLVVSASNSSLVPAGQPLTVLETSNASLLLLENYVRNSSNEINDSEVIRILNVLKTYVETAVEKVKQHYQDSFRPCKCDLYDDTDDDVLTSSAINVKKQLFGTEDNGDEENEQEGIKFQKNSDCVQLNKVESLSGIFSKLEVGTPACINDYDEWKVADLRAKLKALGVNGIAKSSKTELVSKLREFAQQERDISKTTLDNSNFQSNIFCNELQPTVVGPLQNGLPKQTSELPPEVGINPPVIPLKSAVKKAAAKPKKCT